MTRRSRRTTVLNFVRTAIVVMLLASCHRGAVNSEESTSNAPIPRDAARFSISTTNDTMVVFRPLEARWLRVGMRGHAVDPQQRDALIARLTIVSIDTGSVVAKITGQVSQVSATHVVLMVRPRVSWWHDSHFWLGAVTGIVASVSAVAIGR
jgi:hypothetical protein